MKYEKVLLIGGPKDGERISVLEGVSHIVLTITPESPAFLGSTARNEAVSYDRAEYRRVAMQSDQGLQTCVYAFMDIDPLAALINGYRSSR